MTSETTSPPVADVRKTEAPDLDPAVPLRDRVLPIVGKYGTVMGLVVMVAVFSISAPNLFATSANFINIFEQIALTAIIAGGLTMTLAAGEFDLSIGSLASLAGVLVVGLMVNQGLSIPLAILLALATGAVVGLFNGFVVTKTGVNALVATLGTGTILIGINFAYTGGRPLSVQDAAFLEISLGYLAGIPHPVFIMAAVLGVLWVVLNCTDLGQQIQAVGGNAEAARLAGIRVDRVKIWAFTISGVCAALTGVLLAAKIGSGQITGGDGYLLTAFAAAFLGSAALKDGVFHIVGTLIGVLTVGIGLNGLSIFGFETFWQYLFQGTVLILAVALGTVARRYGTR